MPSDRTVNHTAEPSAKPPSSVGALLSAFARAYSNKDEIISADER